MKQLAGYSNTPKSPADLVTTDSRQDERLALAAKRVADMLGFFRQGTAGDPERYVTGIAAMLAQYPENVILLVTDPMRGLPAKLDWLPTLRDVREACEREMEPIRAAQEREARYAETLRLIASQPRHRMTRQQMEEKFGEGWGIQGESEKDLSEKREANLKQRQMANEKVFEAECRKVGQDPKQTRVSPSLIRFMGEKYGIANWPEEDIRDESARRSIHQEAAE
jgi:hypothetical protein